MAKKRFVQAENLTFNSQPADSSKLPPAPMGKRWVKKKRWWQCGPVKYFLLTFVFIFILNYASLKREQAYLLPEGDRYDIGWNQKLFMNCTGHGEPVVIMDAPIGETSDIWIKVAPLLSKYTKVCVYDRAGLGFSDMAYKNTSSYAQDFSKDAHRRDRLQPGTVERMVDDLHRLVDKVIGNDKQLVIVGVGYSTLIARFYAQFYENQVVGLILIDPMVESLFDNNSTWSHHWYDKALVQVNMLYLSSTIGLNRLGLITGLIKPIQDDKITKLVDENFISKKKHFMCSPTHLSSVMEEMYLANTSLAQVKTAFKVKPFPATLPVTMVTYRDMVKVPTPQLAKLWRESQHSLKTIHPQLEVLSIPGEGDNALYLYPQIVSNLIHKKILLL
jgi:pimeloyl-ACP methyl ester carboxylesterase